MRTRREVLTLGAGLVVLPMAAFAEKPTRLLRIGFLSPRRRPASVDTETYGQLPRTLGDLGYVEGKTLAIEWRFAEGENDRLPSLAAELVKLPVDVIVTDGSPGIRAAQGATRTVPIVFGGGSDVVGQGFVKSLARPGGNTTGVTLQISEAMGKQLELLSSAVPRLSRVAVLLNPSNETNLPLAKAIEVSAGSSRLKVLHFAARTEGDIAEAFSSMVRQRAEALIWLPDNLLLMRKQTEIAALALRNGLPSIGATLEYPKMGGLIGHGPNRLDLWRRVAEYVDRIFKGADPASLPVEQPKKLDLVINRTTAKVLGVTIPPDLLVMADQVIE